MKIICSGCSFTAGDELWEEKNIPDYRSLTFKEAFVVKNYDKKILSERENLTYTGFLENVLGCEVINLGEPGSSQQDTMSRTIKKLDQLRKADKNEKLICIMQDTSPDRIWLEFFGKNKSFVLSNLESSKIDKVYALGIQHIYLKYIPDELMHSEYYMQSLAVQNYCANNDIGFLHFRFWKNNPSILIDKFNLVAISEIFLDEKYCIKKTIYQRLFNHYGNNSFQLPGLHIDCESHKLLGSWLIDEMKLRNII